MDVEIELRQTCVACPEQYDALVNEELVGYLRLRHGEFSVECPHVDGDIVLVVYPKGDGEFVPEERDHFLSLARQAIASWLRRRE